MNLHRLSFIIENIYDNDKELTGTVYERLNSASNEYREIVYPELQKISYLAGLLSSNKKFNQDGIGFSKNGRLIQQYSDEINKFCMKLNLPFYKNQNDFLLKAKHQIISRVRSLKNEILNLYEYVKLSFETNVDETIEKILNKYDNKEIKIIYNSSGHENKTIIFDKNEFYEVINNLVQNAIDELNFAESAVNLIEIHSSISSGAVIISVEDNGRGISSDLHNKIFDDGFTTKTTGRGFGLSYVKKTVESYGGKIYLGKSELCGAKFVIQLNQSS